MRMLLTTDTIGGVWTFTQELTAGLLERGHAVALVSLGRQLSAEQQAWADRTRVAASPNCFTYTAFDAPLEWMQENDEAYTPALALRRLADAFNADLVHANQFCFGALAAELPTVVTAHSDVLSWAAACRPEGLPSSPWLTRYKALVRLGLEAADAVTAPTAWMLQALAANFDLPALQRAIPNGRTLDQPVRSDLSNARKLQAITAGRLWDEAKNLSLLLQLNSPVPLIVAGEPPAEQPLGLTFTGYLPEQAVLDLFTESAVYLCPSLYEPFGLAPLEAALCGCAVLANDLPSLREVWQDVALYFTGPAELRSLLLQLLDEPARLADAQAKAFQHAQRYSRAQMTEGYLALYHQVLEAHAA